MQLFTKADTFMCLVDPLKIAVFFFSDVSLVYVIKAKSISDLRLLDSAYRQNWLVLRE